MESTSMIGLYIANFCHPHEMDLSSPPSELHPSYLREFRRNDLIHHTESAAQTLFNFIQTHPEMEVLCPLANRAIQIYSDQNHFTMKIQYIFNAIVTELSEVEQATIPKIDLLLPLITQQVKDYNLCNFIDGILGNLLFDYHDEGHFNSLEETILNATSLGNKADRIRVWLNEHQNELDVIKGLNVRAIDAPLSLIPDEIALFRNLETLTIANHIAMHGDETTREEYLRGERENRNLHYQHRICSIPECLRNLTHLRELNLHNNLISAIPDWIGELSSLNVLNLKGNKITSVPNTIGQLIHLVVLNLNFNEIADLSDEFTSLNKLKTLGLRGNELRELPQNFNLLTKLEELDLAHNHISDLPENIDHLRILKKLLLSHNQIAHLSNTFAELPIVEEIDLSHNQLTVLPDFTFSELKILNLAYNLLTALPNTFHPPQQSLSLAHNRFSELPDDFCRRMFSNFGYNLDLSYNDFTAFPTHFYRFVHYIGKVDLSHNPHLRFRTFLQGLTEWEQQNLPVRFRFSESVAQRLGNQLTRSKIIFEDQEVEVVHIPSAGPLEINPPRREPSISDAISHLMGDSAPRIEPDLLRRYLEVRNEPVITRFQPDLRIPIANIDFRGIVEDARMSEITRPSLLTRIKNIASTILAACLWPFYQLFAAIKWVITKIGEGLQYLSTRVRGVASYIVR